MPEIKDQNFLKTKNGLDVSIIRIIIFSINDSPIKFDLNYLADFLYGARSKFIINNRMEQLRMFSSLSFFSKKDIKKILDSMKKNKLLKFNGRNFRFTTSISEKGLEYWKNPDLTLNILDNIKNDDSINIIQNNETQLLKKLKQYRRSIASGLNIAAYRICIDATLKEMCRIKPRELESLKKIKGTGEKFIERYGSGFQNLLNSFYKEKNI